MLTSRLCFKENHLLMKLNLASFVIYKTVTVFRKRKKKEWRRTFLLSKQMIVWKRYMFGFISFPLLAVFCAVTGTKIKIRLCMKAYSVSILSARRARISYFAAYFGRLTGWFSIQSAGFGALISSYKKKRHEKWLDPDTSIYHKEALDTLYIIYVNARLQGNRPGAADRLFSGN